jgi:hypothetical protein
MNHTTSSQDTEHRDTTSSPLRPLANPRRTRLGADGRPLVVEAPTSA